MKALLKKTNDLTLLEFKASLDAHLPKCTYQQFCNWAISEEKAPSPEEKSPSERWQDVMGLTQLSKLTLGLFNGIVEEKDWDRLMGFMAPISVYQAYEIISDNLAIGLARIVPSDTEKESRRRVLLAFNRAMIKRLQGSKETTAQLLESVREEAQKISGFDQSLSPEKHRQLAALYNKEQRHQPMDRHGDSVEHLAWPTMLANIETCVAMAKKMDSNPVGPLVIEGLIGRYRGVSQMLEGRGMAFPHLVHVGANTILVPPTLAYYAGFLAEDILKLKNFRSVVEDGLLSEASYHASVLLRLLNDLGTDLVAPGEKGEEQRARFMDALKTEAKEDRNASLTFSQLLLELTGRFGPALSRLRKDVQHCEFNVCLHGLMDVPAQQALPIFELRLSQAVALYSLSVDGMQKAQAELDKRLEHKGVSTVIRRFVGFHEQLYALQYSEQDGEYAV